MMRRFLSVFLKPNLADYQVCNFKTNDKQLYTLRLNLVGAIHLKINGVKVPKMDLYLVSTLKGTNKVLIEFRNILFKEQVYIEVNPSNSIDFNSPIFKSVKSNSFSKIKELFYVRKIRSYLISEIPKEASIDISTITYANVVELKYAHRKAVFQSKAISTNPNYNLKNIIEQYG